MIDVGTATWKHLEAVLKERLAALREQNDQPSTEAETAVRRGRIAMLKEILEMPAVEARERIERSRTHALVKGDEGFGPTDFPYNY